MDLIKLIEINKAVQSANEEIAEAKRRIAELQKQRLEILFHPHKIGDEVYSNMTYKSKDRLLKGVLECEVNEYGGLLYFRPYNKDGYPSRKRKYISDIKDIQRIE